MEHYILHSETDRDTSPQVKPYLSKGGVAVECKACGRVYNDLSKIEHRSLILGKGCPSDDCPKRDK
jgi:hypothetical protein